MRRINPQLVDRLLCLAFLAMFIVDLASTPDWRGPAVVNIVLLAGFIPLPLLRRSRPLVAMGLWAGLIAVMAAFFTNPYGLTGAFIGLFVYPFAVGAYVEGKKAWIAVPLTYGVMTAMTLANDEFIWGDIFFPGTFGCMFFLGGRAVRSRSRLTAELHEAALRADEEREAAAARAMADERRRIAREMHDVVAHSVSMMVVQAGGARRILDRDPERAIAAAELIERTGREALAEMRHLLGVLHGDQPAGYAPQPTLAKLDGLVERARAAGLPVTLAVTGERPELPAGLDLAAYRVLQEALTNVIKHGGSAPTEVRVHYRPDAVEVLVTDEGGGEMEAIARDGSGQGLVGMHERVRMFGGELEAGARADGGFAVAVRLPLEGEAEAALTAGMRA